MARVTGPLLSLGGSGQIAQTQVYATWKGRPYVRRYVVPSNPQSTAQTLTRNTFGWLQNVWRYMPSGALAAWNQYATNSRFTAVNGFIKQNLSNLRDETTISQIILSPATGGGIPVQAMTLTPGTGQITVALTAPSLPTGWTIQAGHALAIRQQNPQVDEHFTLTYGTDTSTPYSIVLSGLTASQVYVVGGWFSYAKTPTEFAYGISAIATATPT